MFSLAVMQMGARVYIPTLGRFIQVDPIDGGVLNAYTYVADPINLNDYIGLCAYIIQCTATIEYFQPAAPVSHVQPTLAAAKTQGPGSLRSNTGRASRSAVTPPSPLQRLGSGVAGVTVTAGRGVASGAGAAWDWTTNRARESKAHIEAGIIGCVAGAGTVVGMSVAATLASGGAAAPPAAAAVAISCLTGGSAAVLNSVIPHGGSGVDAYNQFTDALEFYRYFPR